MAINKLPGFGALDLNNQEIIRATNVIPLYEEGTAYAVGDQVITTNENGNPTLYTFNEGVDSAPSTFPMEMVTEAGTVPGVSVGALLPTTTIADDDAPLGELFSLTENAGGRLAGLYRRIADSGNQAAWENVVDKFHVDTALQTGSAAVGTFYSQSGAFATPPDTTYTFAEDKTEGSDTISNLQVFVDGATTSTTDIQLGATQATFIPGVTDEQGIFLSLVRNGESISGGTAEFVNTTTVHGDPDVQESLYLDWEVINGRAALNSAGLDARFEDTYRKNEIETWVENDIPVNSKQAIQYYEVQGRPNRDESAAPGALSSEDIEFSQFEVDLGLQRRTGSVSDYLSKAISFTVTAAESAANQGHWTVAVGANANIFVIKDSEYKEFTMVDSSSDRVTDLHLRCVAYDPLSIPGAHDNQYIRIGCSQGVIFSFRLAEFNKDPKDQKGISAQPSRTSFPNEDITAIATQTHFDGNNDDVHTLAFGTSQGHLSYVSQFINDLSAVDEYIIDFDTTDPLLPIPFDLRFPRASHATSAYPANTAKDGVWVREIKWIGQAAEFIAVGNHQASTRQFAGIPGDALGCPLVAYFRNIQATASLEDGDLYYLTTPFSELFFDNLIGTRDGSSTPEALSTEPTGVENDGSNLPTLNQLFDTALTSVIPVTIGSQDWVYFFGSRQIHNGAHRAFSMRARLDGTLSIIEAINEHDATAGLEPIEGFIQWELVNEISEITGWQNAGTETLPPLNHAQQRYEVRGGNRITGLADSKIIDIFGGNRIVLDFDANTNNLTYSQDAEDGLNHSTNGWVQTDNIHGGWIGNINATDVTGNEFEGFQTLTIMGQSQGTTPLYGISKYVADITVTLRPLNGDANIVLGPIRVPDAQGNLLRTNLLNRLAAEFNAPATGVLQNAPANEVATVSSYDATYGVATISFASDTRDFDISVTTPDIHQIVNFDNDGYEFILRFTQEFVAGEGQEIFVLAHPRLPNDVNGDSISPDDQITLLTSTTDDTPLDKSLYTIRFTVGNLELEIFNTATNEGLPFGTVVQVTYGYNTPAFYQFIHNQATTIVFHDPYHGGSGTIHVPVGMAFADDNALVSYLVGKFSDLFAATNIEVLQEGNSSVIEFRSTLRGDQPGDLILDDDQKIMITVTNPATDPNLENVGVLQINRLFNGDTDFPGKFASTFDFDNALTETDLRSVLHQVFANVGSVGGLNVPVTTAVGDETSVINSANESLYEDNRIVTESHIAEQVVSKHVAGTESSAFTGSVNFVDGSFVDATGVTLDFTGSDVHGFTEHIQIGQGEHTFSPIDDIFFTAESTTVDGTSSIGFETHADYLTFLNEVGLPTVGTGIIQVTAGVNVTLNITRTSPAVDETFTIPDDVRYYYVDPQNTNSRIIFFYNENVSGLPSANIGDATLEVSIPNSTVGVTRLDAGSDIAIDVVGDVASLRYTGSSSGISTVLTDGTTISGNGVDEALSVAVTTLGGLGTPTTEDTVPIWATLPGASEATWHFNDRASIAGVVKAVNINAADTTQSFNTSTGVLNIASSFAGSGSGDGDVMADGDNTFTGANTFTGSITSTGDNTFTGDNVFEIDNGSKGFEIAEYTDDSNNGPELVIDRKRQTTPGSSSTNAPAADGDDIGVIRFQGNDDKAGTNVTYASIGTNIVKAADVTPVGQMYIKVADGSGAGGGRAGSHIRIEGKANGGATIEIDSEADLTVDGTATINGTLVTNGPVTSDSLHIVSGTGHQLRSDAATILNGAITGSGFTTAIDNLLDIRGGGVYGIKTLGGLSIVETDTVANTITLATNQTLAQGEISIPGAAGVLTATGDQDNIQRFLTRAGQTSYYDLATGQPNASSPIRLDGPMINGAGSDNSIYFSTGLNGGGSTILDGTWASARSISTFGNPGNFSLQQWQVGDNIFVYQADDNYAVYTVTAPLPTPSQNFVNLIYVDHSGEPQVNPTAQTGIQVTVIGSLRTIESDGGSGFQYTSQVDFDAADALKFEDNLGVLSITGIFDLTDSGLTTSGGNLTASGTLNGAPVNTMAYLAIQFNSFEPVQVDADSTLSTVYANESITVGGSAAVLAITYQAILDGSAAVAGGVATNFNDYTYVLYKSVYNSRTEAIFLDRIDGNGTTFTTHSFAQSGPVGTVETVVISQQ